MNNKAIVVVDLEATCWQPGHQPPGQNQEIIEIGVAVLHPTGEIERQTDEERLLVNPQFSKISKYCTELTGITQEMVNGAPGFGTVLGQFEIRYDVENRTWASWGAWDQGMFEKNCNFFRAIYPFTGSYINAKDEFAVKRGKRRGMGMARALKEIKIPLEGTHHKGNDDAYNIAKLLRWVLEW